MTHCSDLTEDEHEALQQLTKSARTQSKIVTYGPEMHQTHVDALVEMGFLDYQQKGGSRYLVLIVPCPHKRGLSRSQPSLAEELCTSVHREYAPSERSGEGTAYSLQPPEGGTREASSYQPRDFFLKISSPNDLARYFNHRSKRFRWRAGLTKNDWIPLRSIFKQWREDGATVEDICNAIESFFSNLSMDPEQTLPPKLWKRFVVQRATLGVGKSIDYDKSQRETDATGAVQGLQRAYLARHYERRSASQGDSGSS